MYIVVLYHVYLLYMCRFPMSNDARRTRMSQEVVGIEGRSNLARIKKTSCFLGSIIDLKFNFSNIISVYCWTLGHRWNVVCHTSDVVLHTLNHFYNHYGRHMNNVSAVVTGWRHVLYSLIWVNKIVLTRISNTSLYLKRTVWWCKDWDYTWACSEYVPDS